MLCRWATLFQKLLQKLLLFKNGKSPVFLLSEEQCSHELYPVVNTNGFDTVAKPVLAVIGCGDIGFAPFLVPLLKNLPAVIDGTAGGIGGGSIEWPEPGRFVKIEAGVAVMVIVLFRILVKVTVVTPQAASVDCSKATVFKGPLPVAGKTVIVSVVVKKLMIVVVGSSEFAVTKSFPLTTPSGAGGVVAAGFRVLGPTSMVMVMV
jgi:hypothetical protein